MCEKKKRQLIQHKLHEKLQVFFNGIWTKENKNQTGLKIFIHNYMYVYVIYTYIKHTMSN